MRGKILKGIGGFYYVQTADGVYECRARGIFRKENRKPLVGDDVEISVTDPRDMEGSLDELLPRRNELVRPSAANIDQVLVIFAADRPQPNFNLLDRFLISMRQKHLPVIICFNKSDLVSTETIDAYKSIYAESGALVCSCSVLTGEGLEEVRSLLLEKTTCVAGPSGVGKSSLTNFLCPQTNAVVGDLSRKIGRGKQTTRHTELICFADRSWFLDTPGFASLYLTGLDCRELKDYYPEFVSRQERCRFPGCVHISEPDCEVRAALADGKIHPLRYENYCILYEDLKQTRRYPA